MKKTDKLKTNKVVKETHKKHRKIKKGGLGELKSNFEQSLHKNPTLNLLIKLIIIGDIGIYLFLISLLTYWYLNPILLGS